MDQERIGKFICEMRKERNMTQQELADKLNVTDSAASIVKDVMEKNSLHKAKNYLIKSENKKFEL